MADEATLRISLDFVKGSVTASKSDGPVTFDVAADNPLMSVQDVGTSEEALLLGDAVGAGGYVYMKNLDATNFITVLPGTGVAALIQLLPGDFTVFRLATTATAPFVIADTGACRLEYMLLGL